MSKHHKKKISDEEHHHPKPEEPLIKLIPAFAWEKIICNVKTFKFIVMNYDTSVFNQGQVASISTAITKFIKKYVFPTWRLAVEIQFFVPPSQSAIDASQVANSAYVTAMPQPSTYIPIYLVDEFSANIPNDFGAAVHGCVSGSVMNGPNALFYINDDNSLGEFAPLPFGTPFIVIPAGSAGAEGTGNGINGLIASNSITGEGPINYYQALSLTMCHEIINVLINPTGVRYVGTGNPLGLDNVPPNHTQIFYLREPVDPFSQGTDNTFIYKAWTMSNFAYPAYFFPFNKSGIYDFLGHAVAPFTPYKGTQFSLQQSTIGGDVNNVTDLDVVIHVSPVNKPRNIQIINNGSIYTYKAWGLVAEIADKTALENDVKDFINMVGKSNRHLQNKKINKIYNYKAISNGFYNRRMISRQKFHKNMIANTNNNSFEVTNSVHKKFNPKEPQLLPFQFIDENGFLSTRFVIINYSPEKLIPAQVNKSLPVINKFLEEQFLPYWNISGKITKNYTINSDADLPVFDGTFIPLFILRNDQFDYTKLGRLPAAGGATDVNNVYNILAGPLITEYLLNPPNLPIGNPYVLFPDINFPGQLTVTTNQPGLGPFLGFPMSSAIKFESVLPLTAEGGIASPINACTPLAPGSLAGKIGINVRKGCNSLVYPGVMADAGAIATLTIFAGGAQVFSGAAKVFGATLGPEALPLLDAIKANPNLQITISVATPSVNDFNNFVFTITHEIEEMITDPTYADYIATSDPPTDKAILFSQYEAADPVERSAKMITNKDNTLIYPASAFPDPAYYFANMRYINYDNLGLIPAPLIPSSRQQIVYQVNGETGPEPLQVAWTLGILSSQQSNLDLQTFGNIFDPQTYYPPGNEISYPDGVIEPVADTPLASIYNKLQTLINIFSI